MHISKPYNNDIIIVNNLISDDDLEYLNLILSELDNEVWIAASAGRNYGHLYQKVIDVDHVGDNRAIKILMSIRYLAENILLNNIDSKLTMEPELTLTRLFDKGMDIHADGGAPIPNPPKFGLVFYLNNNYSGGELFYDKLDITYKPVPNDLVIHPGTAEYSHGVKDISNGTRYAATMFAY